MTLDKLSGGVYQKEVTGPVRLCHATSCEGLADIQCDTTRGLLSSLLPDRCRVNVADRYFHNT